MSTSMYRPESDIAINEPREFRDPPRIPPEVRAVLGNRLRDELKGGRLPNVDDGPLAPQPIPRVRPARRLDPDVMPPPPPMLHSRSRFGLLARFAVVIAIAGVGTFVVVNHFPAPNWSRNGGPQLAALDARKAAPAAPRLVLEGGRGAAGEPAPLGARMQDVADGLGVTVTGLRPGTTLSMGEPLGLDSWHVPANDLASTWVLPPPGFVGSMDIAFDVRNGDGRIVTRQNARLEWAPAAAEAAAAPREVSAVPVHAAAPVVAPAPKPVAAAPPRVLEPEEVAILLKRGEELLANGDVSGARLSFRRAAESRDGRAALMLAATYDPAVLQQLGVYGFAPDVALARAWYERAQEFGSAEAPRRLEMLASQTR
jgi:hypothetical protein